MTRALARGLHGGIGTIHARENLHGFMRVLLFTDFVSIIQVDTA
jgi:hypothetical protein